MISLPIQRLDHAHNLDLPFYATSGSSGMDLMAALDQTLRLAPMERALIPSGFAVAIPQGYEGQIRPRSGLALKHGITVLNTPGTIDSDYCGELKILLINLSHNDFLIERGMRIAQLIISPVVQATLKEVESLDPTIRNDNGFGSTGQ